jgi:hypothetical protein
MIWQDMETWVSYAQNRSASDARLVRQSHIALAAATLVGGEFWDEWYCSGALISRHRFVTAHHCNYQDQSIRVSFLHRSPTRVAETESRLRDLGFAPGALLTQATQTALGLWDCGYTSQDGTKDLDYYYCYEKWFVIQPGYWVQLHPGEIFGHMDISTSVPAAGVATHNLTTNRTSSDVNFGLPERILFSPNGIRRAIASTACGATGNAPPGGYTGCQTTQGDDTAGGSSGGASLVASDSRAWAVLSGHFGATSGAYDLQCWLAFPRTQTDACDDKRHTWAPFTATTNQLQYAPRYSSLGTPVYWNTSLAGGTGGVLATHQCQNDEAMIGLVTSRYHDIWAADGSNPLVMGNIGAICAPSLNSQGRYLQYDYATVRTSTSHDTNYQHAIDGAPYPPRLNRYLSTVFGDGHLYVPHLRQESIVCPSGYAVGAVTVRVKYGTIRSITSVVCRPLFDSNLPTRTLTTSDRMGATENFSVPATLDCGGGLVAGGIRTRSGWFTDAIGLRCRG